MKLSHYPISKTVIKKLDSEDLLKYVTIFSKHKLGYRKERTSIITYHMFEDKLCIKLIWGIEKSMKIDNPLSMKYIEKLTQDNILFLNKGEIITHSLRRTYYTNDDKKKFEFILSNKTKKELYHDLEYKVSKPTKLSDDFFNELIQRNNHIISFNKYLDERERQ